MLPLTKQVFSGGGQGIFTNLEPTPKNLHYAGIMQSDCFKLVMWISTADHGALFQHSVAMLC